MPLEPSCRLRLVFLIFVVVEGPSIVVMVITMILMPYFLNFDKTSWPLGAGKN